MSPASRPGQVDRARQTGSVTVTTSSRAQAQSSLPPAQARSQGIALRRGLTLLGMTLVVPGSAQLVGGNERLGRAALRVWFSLIGLALVFVVSLGMVVNHESSKATGGASDASSSTPAKSPKGKKTAKTGGYGGLKAGGIPTPGDWSRQRVLSIVNG